MGAAEFDARAGNAVGACRDARADACPCDTGDASGVHDPGTGCFDARHAQPDWPRRDSAESHPSPGRQDVNAQDVNPQSAGRQSPRQT